MDEGEAKATDPRLPGRACGSCTLCCKVLSITELNKPRSVWCPHCAVGSGCRIYAERPTECREFFCGYLALPGLDEAWHPSTSKIVLVAENDSNRIAAHVDPGRPGAWRQEPFYSQLRRWAIAAASHQGQVIVCVGPKTIVVLPDKEVELGIVAEDERIITQTRRTATGVVFEAFKMKRDDPARRRRLQEAAASPKRSLD